MLLVYIIKVATLGRHLYSSFVIDMGLIIHVYTVILPGRFSTRHYSIVVSICIVNRWREFNTAFGIIRSQSNCIVIKTLL